MSDHQETLKQVVARIEASFVKIETYGKKVDDFRISAGKQLVDLQARVEAGGAGKNVKWWSWYADNFKNRTRRDAQRVMALARSDNPEAAAERARTKNREAVAAHRQREEEAEKAATYGKSQWTEEDYANQIVRDVEGEVANLADVVADLDLVRELILQKLAFAFGREKQEAAPAALNASAEPAEPKKRGRPPGAKNKPKESPEPVTATDADARAGNDVNTDRSANERKERAEAMEQAEAAAPAAPEPQPTTPATSTADDDLDVTERPFYRPAPDKEAA